MPNQPSTQASAPPKPTGTLSRVERGLSTYAFHPLLFAAYPVLILYSDNLADVPFADVIVPMLVVLATTLAVYLLLGRATGDRRGAAIVTTSFMVPVLLFGLISEVIVPGAIPEGRSRAAVLWSPSP